MVKNCSCCSFSFFSGFPKANAAHPLSDAHPPDPDGIVVPPPQAETSVTPFSAATPNVSPTVDTEEADLTRNDSQTRLLTPHPSTSEGASSFGVLTQDDHRLHEATAALTSCPFESASAQAAGSSSSSTVQTVSDVTRNTHEFAAALDGKDVEVDDLNELMKHISEILELIKEGKKWSKMKTKRKRAQEYLPTTSNSFNNLKDFLSETTNFVKDIVPDDGKTIVHGILQTMGTAHFALTGLVVVANMLERFEEVSKNEDDCLLLLKEMIFLAKVVKQIKERPQLMEGMHDEVKEATELILEGSIMCCSQMASSKFSRFFSTSSNKEALVGITQQLDSIYRRINTQMGIEIYDDHKCKTMNLPRRYPKHAVGIDGAVKEVIDLLEWGSDQNALAVILHGFGGMGKTTLAQAVFSKLEIKECKYSTVKLFEDINSPPKIVELQKIMIKDLTGNDPEIRGHEDGQQALEDTFEKAKAFIYIDNVLGAEELKQLLPHDLNKARKVRLLITARENDVRRVCPTKAAVKLYPMRRMSPTEAGSLLSKEMYDETESKLDPKQLDRILKKCGGIPLMLTLVAGALRVAKDKQEIIEVMKQLEKLKGDAFGANKMDSYFFAFNKLPEECKDPFLDICSFFHGWDWDTVADIVGKSELQMLESRALVTKHINGFASLHDIILELGLHKSKEVRFRFTSASEVNEFLDSKEDKDLRAIKGIWLSANKYPLDIPASKLDSMSSSLRILAFESPTKVNGKCSKTFNKLIFFKADITHLPFRVSKLEGLKYLNYKPKDVKLSEMPSNLRHVEFDGILHANDFQISFNDLKLLENLRTLKLMQFSKLKNLPEDMGDLVKDLQELCLSKCTSIKELPISISNLRSLRILNLEGCDSLTELPADIGSLSCLQELHLQSSRLKALPDSVENLSSLKLLDLSFCRDLLNLPPGLGKLTGLVKLDLNICSQLVSIPESIGELQLLQPVLDMSVCESLKELSGGFCKLSFITHLSLRHCNSLEKLPDGFGELASLRVLDLQCCTRLEKLPEGFGQLQCLEELILNDCSHLRELCNDFHRLSSLQNLHLRGCLSLKKLPADFHCLKSLQHLYLVSCRKLEGKWMDEVVKMSRLQLVHIDESQHLVKRWAEIQEEGHQTWSFTVTAGQDWSMSADQKRNTEKALLSDFDRLLTTGGGEPFCLSDLLPNTLFLVVCDVYLYPSINHFPWPLIEEMVDEKQFKIIYIGPHSNKLPPKVKDGIYVGHMSETRARELIDKVYLTLDAATLAAKGVDAGQERYYQMRYFEMKTSVVVDDKSDKYLPSWKLLTDSEMEEVVLSKSTRYLRLKRLVETPQDSNIELLTELFAPEDKESTHIFTKYQDLSENSEPFTCGIEELKGKNILLEMRSAHLHCDIRLSSLNEMYGIEKERLNLEIISIPIVEPEPGAKFDVFDVYKQFTAEVPWLVLQNSWTIITRAVKYFLFKHCGWQVGDEYEKCYTSILWLIESNGRITIYNPSLFCELDKWKVFLNYLESVSYQSRWGSKVRWVNTEELRKEEWKQLNSMSTLKFIFNHIEGVSDQVTEMMFQGKMICLLLNSWFSEDGTCMLNSMLNSMMEVRDSIQIIYISGELKDFSLTDTIKKDCYHPLEKALEIEGVSLNLSGKEAVSFWMRLLHLKEEINGMDDTDKQFCEIRRLLHSFQLTEIDVPTRYVYCGCMIFMSEDGKIVATCRNAIVMWLFFFDKKRMEDRAKRLMQLLIKVSMEEMETHHDFSFPDVTNKMKIAATAIDKETVDLDLDSLSLYTTDLLEYEELYQFLEFNKERKISSQRKAGHHWPTSKGFSMLKNLLSEGINANWIKDIISGLPEEDKWKTVTRILLKQLGEADWAAAGLLVVAEVLERFETICANRNECLFLLDDMNSLAIYVKQFKERPGSWTGMKREATGSIVIGAIMCCTQIDPSKFAMFFGNTIDNKDLRSFQWELSLKCNIMAESITDGVGSESGYLLGKMCKDYSIDFVTGDLEDENETLDGPSADDISDLSSMVKACPTGTATEEDLTPSLSFVAARDATHEDHNAQPYIAPSPASSSS